MLRAKKINGQPLPGGGVGQASLSNSHHNNSTDIPLAQNYSKQGAPSINHEISSQQAYHNYLQKMPMSKASANGGTSHSYDKYTNPHQQSIQQQSHYDHKMSNNSNGGQNSHQQMQNMSSNTNQHGGNGQGSSILQSSINKNSNQPHTGSENRQSNGAGPGSTHASFPNAYISQSPQPNQNLRAKKNNLMVYGFNGNQQSNKSGTLGNGHSQNGGLILQLGLHSMTNSNQNLNNESYQPGAPNSGQTPATHNMTSTALNIKSQKAINGSIQINHHPSTSAGMIISSNPQNQSIKEKELQMMSIKKEKERISSLLNQNQGNQGKIVVPSSRNQKDDQQASSNTGEPGVGNSSNGGQNQLSNIKGGERAATNGSPPQQLQQQSQLPPSNGSSPYRYTSSFQVQPSNIHELNSFLNSNHYYQANGTQNAADFLNERRKIPTNSGVGNLITRKNLQSSNASAISNLDKPNEYLSNGPIQHGLVSASKGKDIRFQQSEEMKTIETELRAANDPNGYPGFLSDSLDKHSKSVISKNSGSQLGNLQQVHIIPSKASALKSINKLLEQKRSFDFTSKRPNAAGGGSRQGNDGDMLQDINQEVHEIINQATQINNSFTDKKPLSSKWVLMNSKHVRNKSEAKIVGQAALGKNIQSGGMATSQLNQLLAKDFNLKNGIYNQDEGAQHHNRSQYEAQKQQQQNQIVSKYACKTRQGFIPNTKKTNQDAYIIQKEFAGIKGCWFLAVFDGHGMNGHLVSDFCKRTIPITLSNIINGGNGVDPIPAVATASQGKKRKNKGSRHFLPPLVSSSKKDGNAHSFVESSHNGIYDDMNPNKNQALTQNSISGDSGKDTQNDIQTWFTSNPVVRDTQVRESFRITQEKLEYGTKIDCMFSGTTAVAVLIHQTSVLCANSGDSRAILCSQNGAGIWSYTPLNRDHKPDESDEAARVKKCNGRIEQSRLMPGQPGYGMSGSVHNNQPQFFGPKRVWLKHKQVPGLAMTRSMGDLVAKSVGVTYEPEIKVISNLTSQDKFIVIASDGLWDRIPNDEVCRIVANPFYERGDPEGAVQFLAKESAERWTREQGMIDDITIIVAFINPQSGSMQAASHNASHMSNGHNGTPYGNQATSTTTATNNRTESRATSNI